MYHHTALTGAWTIGWVMRTDPLASHDRATRDAPDGDDEHSQLLEYIDQHHQQQHQAQTRDEEDGTDSADDDIHEAYTVHTPTLQETASMFIARHWRDLGEHVDLLPPALRVFPLLCVCADAVHRPP